MKQTKRRKQANVKLLLGPNGALFLEKSQLAAVAGKGLEPQEFEKVTAVLEGITEPIMKTWKKVKPTKATVEFGLELGAETGVIATLVAKGSGKASLTVTLEWATSSAPDSEQGDKK